MTQLSDNIEKHSGATRLPAELAGFCCENLNCPECLSVFRKGRALRSKSVSPRKPRQPTLVSVAKQASKAGIPVARYEVKPDGTVVVVTGQGESAEPNPWLEGPKVTKQ